MPIWKVIVLAIVQGLAELLPVSSSAHVVTAEKLMHLDPAAPAMTLLLVMMHTGTMCSVIVYFWLQWRDAYFSTPERLKRTAAHLAVATILTGVIGEAIVKVIEHTLFKGAPKAQIEDLFGRLDLVAPALFAAGLLILIAGLRERAAESALRKEPSSSELTFNQATWMGAVQGLCLPFRGFSRSGATISTGMLAGAPRLTAERFSFALAVILTPPVVLREALRLHHAPVAASLDPHAAIVTSLIGCVLAFLAGLLALQWLSRWLEQGRWYLFGVYCLLASILVFMLYRAGY